MGDVQLQRMTNNGGRLARAHPAIRSWDSRKNVGRWTGDKIRDKGYSSDQCSPRLIGSAHSQSGHCDWLRSVDGIESGGGCGVDEGVVAGGVLVF
jgi:hypothetical protein